MTVATRAMLTRKQSRKYSNSSVSASNAFQKNGIRTNRIRTNRGRIYVVKGTGTLTNKPMFALIEFALFEDRTNRGIAVLYNLGNGKVTGYLEFDVKCCPISLGVQAVPCSLVFSTVYFGDV